MSLKYTAQHHGANEPLCRVVQYRVVQYSDVLTTVECVLWHRTSVGKPSRINVVVLLPMDQEWRPALGQSGPEWIEIRMAGRLIAADAMTHSDPFQTLTEGKLEFFTASAGLSSEIQTMPNRRDHHRHKTLSWPECVREQRRTSHEYQALSRRELLPIALRK